MKKLVITRRGRREETLDESEIVARKDAAETVKRVAETQAVLNRRRAEYGSAEQQLEFIAENGIEAFIARQQAIKAKFPKPSEEKIKPRKKARKK